jgi:hypothetical protein
MIRPNQFLSIFFFFLLIGCGGSNMMMQPPNTPSATLNGSFAFAGQSQSAQQTTIYIGGPLQTDSAGHVSGTLGITTNPNITTCFPSGSSAAFSGSISNGQLMLTSAAVNGQVITLTAMVNSDGLFFSQANYSVAGGCLGGDQGHVTISHLLAGTYTGSFFAGGHLLTVSLNFGAPGMPLTNGSFPINAAGTFTNADSCGGFTSATSQSGSQDFLNLDFTMTSNVTGTSLSFIGTSGDGSGTQFMGNVGISGGPCNAANAPVTLKKM